MRLNFNLNKVINFLKKIPEGIANKSFSAFLILSLLAFLIAGFIFYKYYYKIEKFEPEIIGEQFKIDKESYQELLNFWNLRQQKFEETGLNEYKDPFQGLLK